MRVLLACLIVLGALIASTVGFAMLGASKVKRDLAFETSCKLLDAAEKEGWLSRSQRFDVIRQIVESATLRQSVRAAADRLRTGCPKR